MAVIEDNETYEQQQLALLCDLLLAIKDELESADLDYDQVVELTGRIGYAVASTIDGRQPGEEAKLRPRLAFATDEGGRERLVVNERGSYLHELVYSLFAEVFDQFEDDDMDEEELEEELEEDEEYGEDDEDDEGLDRIH